MASDPRKTKAGNWEVFVYMGRDSQGKQIRESSTFDTKKEAQRWARDKELEKETGILMEFANMTFKQYIDKWFDEYVDEQLSPVTHDRYYNVFYHQVLKVLGKLKLKEIQPAHIQSYLTSIRKRGGSTKTQQYHYAIISSALTYADEMNYIYQNPMQNVRKPGGKTQRKVTKKKKKVKAINRDMLKKWLEFVQDYDQYLFDYCYIAINTGMCLEEMIGSRWKDLNFSKGIITVEQVAVYVTGKGTVFKETPKAADRFRKIPISDSLANFYRGIWKRQQEMKMHLGDEYKDHNLILCKDNGEHYAPRTVQNKIRKAREAGGFPDWITSHIFRHTFASLFLAENKNIKELQKLLGHSSYVITADTYSHFLKKDFERARNDISKAVGSVFSVQD